VIFTPLQGATWGAGGVILGGIKINAACGNWYEQAMEGTYVTPVTRADVAVSSDVTAYTPSPKFTATATNLQTVEHAKLIASFNQATETQYASLR
jgi:hypothetical protein